MNTPEVFRLGKKPPEEDPLGRTLKFSKYVIPSELPPIPPMVNWGDIVKKWYMLGNDRRGDCTFAGAMHLDMLWTANAGEPFIPTDQQVVDAYDTFTHGIDSGCTMLSLLKLWRKKGICGRKIIAFVSIDSTNRNEVKEAINLFGGLIIGLSLPDYTVPYTGDWPNIPWWSTAAAPNDDNGHCVSIVCYEDYLKVVTWGKKKNMGFPFFAKYCGGEAFAIVTSDWINKQGKSPNGFDLNTLLKDLKLVTAL